MVVIYPMHWLQRPHKVELLCEQLHRAPANLRHCASPGARYSAEAIAGGGGDIETGSPPPPPPVNEEKDRYMDEFFREVSSIKVSNTPIMCC